MMSFIIFDVEKYSLYSNFIRVSFDKQDTFAFDTTIKCFIQKLLSSPAEPKYDKCGFKRFILGIMEHSKALKLLYFHMSREIRKRKLIHHKL